jgi:sortase A
VGGILQVPPAGLRPSPLRQMGDDAVMTSQAARRPLERLLSGGLTVVILAILAFIGWQFLGTNRASAHKQHTVVGAIEDDWFDRTGDANDDRLRIGQGFAILRIPRFGADFAVPVIQGVGDSELASGVGHFSDTARPGQIGNFAVAGHRVTRGQPFADFPSLRAGDKVIVETRTDVFTYVLDGGGTDLTVDHRDIAVVQPVPGHPKATPRTALITLVTCSEIYHTDNRSVVHGYLVSAEHV